MNDVTESDKQCMKKISVKVPSTLQLRLRKAFEEKYLSPGKKRARTGEFLSNWQLKLGDAPSDQALWNVLKAKRDTVEY
jgi:hypothetical protein